jgi:transcriptional repressor OPI1
MATEPQHRKLTDFATHHDPETLDLPSVPNHDLQSMSTIEGIQLPHIKSLGLLDSAAHQQNASSRQGTTTPSVRWGSVGSPMDTAETIRSEEVAHNGAASVVSIDDPDVRTAAEALTGLRSPTNITTTRGSPTNQTTEPEPEPLLQLLTSSHPWLGSTINGSIQAYTVTKFYSPSVVRNIAESVERNIGSPVANTVSAVGRRTGVEGGIRRYLEHRRPSDLEQASGSEQNGSNKRRRLESSADLMDVEQGLGTPAYIRSRTGSQASYPESLPPYDEHRSPRYEEVASPGSTQARNERQPWTTQLVVTTSGLGVALNDAALNNLKYVLSILRGSMASVTDVVSALKLMIVDFENQNQTEQPDGGFSKEEVATKDSAREERRKRLAEQMQQNALKIWETLHTVIRKVSVYAGGALPANASQLVRTQLTSIQYRWHNASRTADSQNHSSDEVKNANRMVAFAKEGLDMMTQVSKVVEQTLVSAETWLDRMGRRKNNPSQFPEKTNPFNPSRPVGHDGYRNISQATQAEQAELREAAEGLMKTKEARS